MPRRFDVAGLRARMGVSQTELADRVGVTPRTIRRWELAEVDPSPAATKLLRQVKDAHENGNTGNTSDTRSDNSPAGDTTDDALTAAAKRASRGPRRLSAVLPGLP